MNNYSGAIDHILLQTINTPHHSYLSNTNGVSSLMIKAGTVMLIPSYLRNIHYLFPHSLTISCPYLK